MCVCVRVEGFKTFGEFSKSDTFRYIFMSSILKNRQISLRAKNHKNLPNLRKNYLQIPPFCFKEHLHKRKIRDYIFYICLDPQIGRNDFFTLAKKKYK